MMHSHRFNLSKNNLIGCFSSNVLLIQFTRAFGSANNNQCVRYRGSHLGLYLSKNVNISFKNNKVSTNLIQTACVDK